MNFDEISQSILGASNQYEKDKGIQTLMPRCIYHEENWAIFEAEKTDKTRTIFYARKNKRSDDSSWTWLCPSEAEVRRGFPKLCTFYNMINQDNIQRRHVF